MKETNTAVLQLNSIISPEGEEIGNKQSTSKDQKTEVKGKSLICRKWKQR